MPCRSDYLEANDREIESSIVRELLRETRGEKFNHKERVEYYGAVATLDQDTAALCEWCQSHDVTRKSLELQVWWRDHQTADRRRAEAEARKARAAVQAEEKRHAAQKVLDKLTPAEAAVLGFKKY